MSEIKILSFEEFNTLMRTGKGKPEYGEEELPYRSNITSAGITELKLKENNVTYECLITADIKLLYEKYKTEFEKGPFEITLAYIMENSNHVNDLIDKCKADAATDTDAAATDAAATDAATDAATIATTDTALATTDTAPAPIAAALAAPIANTDTDTDTDTESYEGNHQNIDETERKITDLAKQVSTFVVTEKNNPYLDTILQKYSGNDTKDKLITLGTQIYNIKVDANNVTKINSILKDTRSLTGGSRKKVIKFRRNTRKGSRRNTRKRSRKRSRRNTRKGSKKRLKKK